MRAYIPSYQIICPQSLGEALDLLAQHDGAWKAFAGGTDLMVLLEAGKLSHQNYVDIWNLKELRGTTVGDSRVTLGALTTYTEVRSHPVMRAEFPMLCQAAKETGGLAIQNRGTLGGNIINASPAADSPPALLAYDAELELISASGARRVAYRDFHTGYKQMLLRPDELLARIFLPRTPGGLRQYYRKVGTRKAQAISKVCLAATARMNGRVIQDVRLALGSVAPVPLRCVATETWLRGKAIEPATIAGARSELAREISPIDDIRSTRDYRLRVSQNLIADFLSHL